MFPKPNLENNGEIIVENEGENYYEPIITNYANTKNIQEKYIYPRRSPKNKGKNNLKKSPKFKRNNLINKMLNKNLTDYNYITNDDNMANKINKEITMKYTKKDKLNLEYMRKFNNKNISNGKVLMFNKLKDEKRVNINNDILNFNFNDNIFATYNGIKINDSFLKGSNKLDNGNCGNKLEFKMLSNNIVKTKELKAKHQKNNSIDINNNSKNSKFYFKKVKSSFLNNGNSGEYFSGILNYKNINKLPLDEFINKNPINFNQCQILTNNNKVMRYNNNIIDFKFDKERNSHIVAINLINNFQENEDISLSAPKSIRKSNSNKVNKLTTNFYKKNVNNLNFADLLNNNN
jgi:hypothetical protein